MEKVHLKKVRCQAKVMGTLVTVGGAMLMTLYKGPIMDMAWTKHAQLQHANVPAAADKDWLKGCIFLIIATLAWASLFILQGIVTSSIAYYVQGLVIQDKGPVFASAFSPLMMIIVAIMGSFILAEKIYLGGSSTSFSSLCRVVGAALIVAGLYFVLWGKHKEYKEKEMEALDIPVAVKSIIELDEVELEKDKANNNLVISPLDKAVVVVNVPIPENSMKAKKEEL
ncbi:hypothetical protein GW17_00005936 [Ensete ventricosum]|nr:hypothetical protein GW17_00005936 [Ensete ventricosum]RZS00194.1 hypothetical protein BHM03_00029846 [Ensete ventricosum]